MSEFNLTVVPEDDNKDEVKNTPMEEVNDALKACKFGWFHLRLLYSALVGYTSGVLVSNSTAYILPKAECDLDMDLTQKGLLNAMPFFGMLFSSVVAGFLTDTFGRKPFMLIGYGGVFIFTLIGGSSQNYEVLVTSKFFEGALFAANFTPTLTLTSEFLYSGIRDRFMICQSSFSALAQVIIAGMAWGVLTQNWQYVFFNGYFVLHTWNFFLYIVALWSLAAFVLYYFVPESPKFLVSQQRYDEAREILIKVYMENTGKPAATYPYVNIWKTKDKQTNDNVSKKLETTLARQVVAGLRNAKPLFRKPLGFRLMLLSVVVCCSMVLYNIIRLWFPQLSTIVEHFGGGSRDLCVVLDAYTEVERRIALNKTETDVCVPKESGAETYINSIILGTSNFSAYFVTGMLVNKVGKKCLLLALGLISFGATLALRWMSSKTAVVALFSLDASVSNSLIALYQAVVIEFFPTTTRSLALSIIMVVGRIGTLLSNIAFPILLKIGCVIPFYSLAGMMLFVTMLTIVLPRKK